MTILSLTLFGERNMGAALRAAAERRGHRIVAVVTRMHGVTGDLAAAEAGLDFSHADALDMYLEIALERRLPLVIGATGLESPNWRHKRSVGKSRWDRRGAQSEL